MFLGLFFYEILFIFLPELQLKQKSRSVWRPDAPAPAGAAVGPHCSDVIAEQSFQWSLKTSI